MAFCITSPIVNQMESMDFPPRGVSEANGCEVTEGTGKNGEESSDNAKPSKKAMLGAGEAKIKKEFLVLDRVRTQCLDDVSGKDEAQLEPGQSETPDPKDERDADVSEPLQKKLKLSKQEKKKFKGQNKNRPPPMKLTFSQRLCPTLLDVAEDEEAKKCVFPNCAYQHDVEKFLSTKPVDLGEECYVFKMYGRCPRGLACRFGSGHISGNYNIVNKDLVKLNGNKPFTINALSKNLQFDLRKHKYDFSRSEKLINSFSGKAKFKEENTEEKDEINAEVTNGEAEEKCDNSGDSSRKKLQSKTESEKDVKVTCGIVTDEDIISLREGEKKKINWNDKLYLAPLTTVGNLPFRRICKEFGADITCSEMAMSTSLLQGGQQEWALVKRHESEDLFGVQLCGNNPYVIGKCAQLLEENISMDFVDVNLGCPIDLVYQQGSGSGLMRRERPLQAIVSCTSRLLSIPLTVKMRTGVYMDKNIAHHLAPKCRDWGASMVTVHGRSREQRYTRGADWAYVDHCAQVASPLPIFGSGDVMSYEEYNSRRENSNVAGIMFARGALIKPWIFTEIKEQRHWDISSKERFDVLKKYVNYGLEHWGSDSQGVENTRRFLLEWLSFLHRYIPVGLLESPPQRINERPPFYRGRDDLETLMASTNCADWVRISEMLLGPVPDSFTFLPKHKANSWK